MVLVNKLEGEKGRRGDMLTAELQDKLGKNNITDEKNENSKRISEALWVNCRRSGLIVSWHGQYKLDERHRKPCKKFRNDPAIQTL
jgi:hypothetical protein